MSVGLGGAGRLLGFPRDCLAVLQAGEGRESVSIFFSLSFAKQAEDFP